MKITPALIAPPLLAAATLLAVDVGCAADFPRRKPGLWELTIAGDGGRRPPRTSRFCLDAATDALLMRNAVGADQKDCSKQSVDVHGAQAAVHSVCTIMGHQATTDVAIAYQGDTAVHMEIHSLYSPPMFGRSESSSQLDAHWIGDCGAEMAPGDMLLPGGVKMNILKMTVGR